MADTAETTSTAKSGPWAIPFPETPYDSPYTSIGKSVCTNMYYEASKSTTNIWGYYYISIPPLKILGKAKSTSKSSCRGLYTTGSGRVLGVWANSLIEIFSDGTRQILGSLSSYSGPVRMADNSTEVCIVDGKAGYILVLNTNDFSKITDEYFPGVSDNDDTKAPTHVVCIDSYFLVNRHNSNEYYWSTPGYVPVDFDGTDHVWNGLYFGVKAGTSDEIKAMCQAVSYLWLFGEQSIEVHYDAGGGTADNINYQTFSRIEGAFIKMGTSAPSSVVSVYNNVFWIGTDQYGAIGIYGADQSFSPVKLSTLYIDTMLSAMESYTDAIGHIHSHSGHTFIGWYFPTARQTWMYDITTKKWHRRCYKDYISGADEDPWMGLYATEAFSKVLVGDRASDAVFYLEPNAGFDRSIPRANDNADGDGINDLQCTITSTPQVNQGRLTRYRSFYLMCQQGMGLTVDITAPGGLTGYGKNPKAMISWADDGGNRWSNEHQISLGAVGSYSKRPRMQKMSMGRMRIWKVRISDPVAVVLDGIMVDYQIMGR